MVTKQKVVITFLNTVVVCCLAFVGYVYGGITTGSADVVLGQNNFVFYSPNMINSKGLYNPCNVAIDATTGRVYVADTSNSRVLWWNNITSLTDGKPADGVLGQPDLYSNLPNRGGSVAANTLSLPLGVSVDSSGNVWVADTDNHRVLKYTTPSQNGVSADLVLGQANFTSGSSNRGGSVAANTLCGPSGVSVDSSGNVWVADTYNNRVLKYNKPTQNGVSANLVLGQADFTYGSSNRGGSVAANTLYEPSGVSVDSSGNVWVADTWNYRVLKYTTPSQNGVSADLVLGQANFTSGSSNRGGSVAANTLFGPNCVAVDSSGNVWVADTYNNRVLKYNKPTQNGVDANLVLGQENFTSNYPDSTAANTLFRPRGVAVDSSGNVWVADTYNNRVLKYTTPAQNGVSANLVLGQNNFVSYSPNMINSKGLYNPRNVAIDATTGRVYVADTSNSRVLWWNNITSLTDGKPADGVLGQPDLYSNLPNRGGSVAANTLSLPLGVSVDSSGNVWVADTDNHRVLKYTTPSQNGVSANLVLGQADFISNSYNRGGSVAANTLCGPSGVSVDSSGNVWVADTYNNRVLKYTTPAQNGVSANLVLGQADFISNSYNRGGSVAANTLCGPSGVAVDSSGNVWVADTWNHRVLKYTTPAQNGVSANLVLGQADFTSESSNRGGSVAANTLSYPSGVSIDDSGNVWVADTYNNRVLKYTAPTILFTETTLNPQEPTTVRITPETGGIKVYIPANTFTESLTMTVSTATAPESDRATIKVVPIAIEITTDKSLQPQKEITITIYYRDSDIAGFDETKLVLGRYDDKNSRWLPIPSTVYPDPNYVSGRTNHLSKFALLQLSAAGNLQSAKVFPNPFNPNVHTQGLTFEGLTAEATIKIYTITGELVKEIVETNRDGRAYWDGKNDAGNVVASGVYIALIKGGSDTKKLKIAVEK